MVKIKKKNKAKSSSDEKSKNLTKTVSPVEETDKINSESEREPGLYFIL